MLCFAKVWVSPAGQQMLADETAEKIVCNGCLAGAVKTISPDEDLKVQITPQVIQEAMEYCPE